jgi:SAM-dependent methyltransferase
MKRCINCQRLFDSANWECPACAFVPPVKDGITLLAPQVGRSGSGYEPDAYAQLFELEQNNFWFRARNRIISWAIRRYAPTAKDFLEIGCGTGFVLSEIETTFPSMYCAGSEYHVEGLTFARRRLKRADLWQMDATDIPFSEAFDVIGAFDVLEHIKDDRGALEQMRAALRPGGSIVLTVPQHPSLWSPADDFAHHERRYRMGELEDKVSGAGFSVVRSTSFVTTLLPFMALARIAGRLFRLRYSVQRGLTLPRRVDRIFERAISMERLLIERGRDLPVGGSRLVVAAKNC